MKKLYYERVEVKKDADLTFILPINMQPTGEGETQPQAIEVEDIRDLCVRVAGVGETGIGKRIGTEGATRYELDGSEIIVHVAAVHAAGEVSVLVNGKYGQVCLRAKAVAVVGASDATEIELPAYVFDAIAAGGGSDYKTDIYMDGAGRVLLERLEDGSTMLLDEHENPILKRNADGSTQYFDAYQSARLLIGTNGEVMVAYTEDETVKTLAVAEAILARTQKRLLYNTAGETTIKDAEGNILTHADIYAMLMTSPDFVVLIRSDHAFHPNLVTPTQIAFTCSYLGADEQISAERVNITSENVVTYTSGKGVTAAANGGVAIGLGTSATGDNSFAQGWGGTASGAYSHAEGYETQAKGEWTHAEGTSCVTEGQGSHAEGGRCKALMHNSHAEGEATEARGGSSHAEGEGCQTYGIRSHAEGFYTQAKGINSHVEGTRCITKAGTSHAEGNFCETGTNGGSAHAEGSYTNANGSASHAEGYRTVTTEGGQHAQGCWNKVEGGEFAFMHGCGTDADNLCNAFIIAGDQVYMRGIGGYDGTNYGAEGVKSAQTVIRELQLKLVNF